MILSISWNCKHTWKKARINTLWCLLGCSIGDFGTIYFFQVTEYLNPTDHKWIILSLAIINGLITSIMLETFILSRQMILREAFKVAIGMSLISMISMEAAHEYRGCYYYRRRYVDPSGYITYVNCRLYYAFYPIIIID